MRRSLNVAAVVALFLCTILLAVPVSSSDAGDPVVCNGVTVVSFSDTVDLNIASTSSICIAVFNNNNSDITMEILQSESSPIHASVSKNNILVKAGAEAIIYAELKADRFASEGTYTVNLTMAVMNDGIEETAILPSTVNLSSTYSPGVVYNTIMGIMPNNFPAPLNMPLASAIFSFIGWIFVAIFGVLFTYLILRIVFIQLDGEPDAICNTTGTAVFVCILIYGFSNCLRVYGASEELIADVSYVSLFLYLVIGAFIAWNFYKALVELTFVKLEKEVGISGLDTSLVPLFKVIGKILIVVVGVAMFLSMMGMGTGAIVAGAGIAGIAVSLGAKSVLNELFCGLTLLLTRPFRKGDTIIVGTSTEAIVVERVGIMMSEFSKSWTMEHFTMPNSTLTSSMITNITGRTRRARSLIYVNVPYDVNLELVKKLIKESAYAHDCVVTDGSVDRPEVRLMSFGASALSLRLSFYVTDYAILGSTSGQIREIILHKLKENDIKIPFQQKDIVIIKDGGAKDVSSS